MFLLERQPEDVLFGQQPAQVVRVLRLLIDLGRAWRDPLLRDLTDRVAEVQVLLRNRVDLLRLTPINRTQMP